VSTFFVLFPLFNFYILGKIILSSLHTSSREHLVFLCGDHKINFSLMVSAMDAIRWDLRNPQAIFKGSFTTP